MNISNTKEYTVHQCQLRQESDSCLPPLSPITGKYTRMIHKWRKILTVSKANPRTKMFFRSIASITMERKRQIHTAPFYIIHPFSIFNLYVECTMCFCWMISYFLDPIFVAFYSISRSDMGEFLVVISLFSTFILIINIALCFITGYQVAKTKEIVLSPKQIAKRYLLTYFFFDFIGGLPFRYVILFFRELLLDQVHYQMLSVIHLLRIARIYTTMHCLRQITLLLKVNDLIHIVFCMAVLTMLFLHWLACIVYSCNNILFYVQGTLAGESWLRRLGVSGAQDTRWYQKYIYCLHTVVLNFYCISSGMEPSHVFSEHIILSFVMIFGSIYFVYALVITLQLVRSTTTSTSKYEEFLYQLKDYMRAKMLPQSLRRRIVLYYEHRFQKKFFREQAILDALSGHLRDEILLHSCKHLLHQVSFFRYLPKHVVGLILASLKQEIFLPNDIILKANMKQGCMYFISYGTVAVYTESGQECIHLTDGMHFGVEMLTHGKWERFGYNCVAVDFTECYRWEKADYLKCSHAYKGLDEALEKIRLQDLHAIQVAEVEVNSYKDNDVLTDLRRQRIIERGAYREYVHRSKLSEIPRNT